jgi:hypothetical protein
VLVLLEQQSVRSEECFSALCLLDMVKAKLDALMAAEPLAAKRSYAGTVLRHRPISPSS